MPTRLPALRAAIKKAGHENFLITNPLDVAYLTGFHGGDSYILMMGKSAVLISDFRYQEELEHLNGELTIVIRKGAMAKEVANVVGQLKECAVQAEAMTLAEYTALDKALKTKLIQTTGIVAAMRSIKDADEVKLIKKAVKIQEQALLAVLPSLKPGMTELAIAAMIEAEMKTRGSSAPGFQTIVAAQPNGSFPHYRPGSKKTAANKTLLIDWGAIFQGYHSDMTRVYAFNSWPRKIAEIYAIALEAKELAADALRPGATSLEIDTIARSYITRHGYGEYFGHGLGHGIGFNGHEDPRMTHMASPTVLMPGHVITIEPGIYLPGVGGVRIEDDYVITQRGATNLCSLPQSMEECTL
jgi:Xaa-Pro aminopeptidase